MLVRYVRADLVRNPRRTLSTVVGVILGVGLACAVLFFVDGLSASMTQKAVAPLLVDMQRILTESISEDIRLKMTVNPSGSAQSGDIIQVWLELENLGNTPANETIVRSVPSSGLVYVPGSAQIDGEIVADAGENPLARGPGRAGYNLGTVEAGAVVTFEYQVIVSEAREISDGNFASTFSTREILTPVRANAPERISLAELAAQIELLDGIAFAEQLSFVDLSPGALSADKPIDGLTRLFGFDTRFIELNDSIQIIEGTQVLGKAMVSAEVAGFLSVDLNDSISLNLPDGTLLETEVSGIVNLTQSRSLFSSRRGADLETFVYIPYSVIIDSTTFTNLVMPAFKRAITDRGDRVKNPPIREVDIGVARELLDSAPQVALLQTQQIAQAISNVATEQDFLLDNISNTLAVARDDARVARRMFIFLGVPGAMLAATLSAYAGVVLAGAQRREQATLRIRGASRRHLLWMLAMRVSVIIALGAAAGVILGFFSVVAVIGQRTLLRATTESLIVSALLGTFAGLVATGTALYLTGRRAIDRDINEHRARLWTQPPVWRRYFLDLMGLVAVLVATAIAIRNASFEGTAGSVYAGRAVKLSIGLLILPLGAWVAGSLFGGRSFAWSISRLRTKFSGNYDRPLLLLYWMSVKRRKWVLVDAVIIQGMIIALATSLAVFTASYDGAKSADSRYIIGSDLRITPSPASERIYMSSDTGGFLIDGVDAVVPVVYGVHNVVLRSKRTSDVANLAALYPETYAQVATFDDTHFWNRSSESAMKMLAAKPNAVLLSRTMADFLQVEIGDTLRVLLARATPVQIEVETEVIGLFERLPGFPDGADVLMNITYHEAMIPSTFPSFFLVQLVDRSDAVLRVVSSELSNIHGSAEAFQIDTRLTALAKDQSSLAALNINGLLKLDSGYSLAMGVVTVAIFVFSLLLQRRREYVTLRAQGMQPRAIRTFIGAEAGTTAVVGSAVGVMVGLVMAFYFTNVLRPLFVLDPPYIVPLESLSVIVGLVLLATIITSVAASALVNRLRATELLRDE